MPGSEPLYPESRDVAVRQALIWGANERAAGATCRAFQQTALQQTALQQAALQQAAFEQTAFQQRSQRNEPVELAGGGELLALDLRAPTLASRGHRKSDRLPGPRARRLPVQLTLDITRVSFESLD